MRCILGVDIGTTNTKAIAFNLKGRVLARKDISYPILNPKPNWSEQDPDVILRAVKDSIKNVARRCRKHEIIAISFSCAMHSLMAVSKRGPALTRLMIWADSRSADYAESLSASQEGRKIYRETGTPIHPMSPLCKLLWMKQHQPDIYRKAHKFISIKEFIFHHFFGDYAVDYGIASATGLFDIFRLRWSHRALKLLGLKEERLSRPVSPTTIFRGLDKKSANTLGISQHIPWVIGGSDGCLANLGANAVRPGHAAITIGTSGAIRVVSPKALSDPKGRTFSYILDEEHFVLGGPVNNGGIVLQWFRDHFTHKESYRELAKKATRISAGSEGLIFLPYLLGERAPHWDAHARGVYFGINLKHGRDHFLRATMEGVIFGLYSVDKALQELLGNMKKIYVTGGLAASDLWLHMIADIFNRTVHVAAGAESSCLGAAMLAMKALGEITRFEQVENLVPIARTIHPDRARHKTYQKNYSIFDRLYHRLKEDFARIAQMQE